MRYARITGDREAQAAGERALAFMESFRVPRGAQGWECPVYEPDILALVTRCARMTKRFARREMIAGCRTQCIGPRLVCHLYIYGRCRIAR